MKKVLKYMIMSFLSVFSFLIIYALSILIFSSITIEKEANTTEEVEIYIKTNGVHTDLVLPIQNEQINWCKEIKFENTVSKDTNQQFVGIGWGDKGFYLETPKWEDLKVSVAFKAAFALSSTAIHTTFYNRMIESESCKKIKISKKQYTRLIKYISDSFQKDANGHFINIQTTAHYNKADAFYEAKGRYSLFFTCNSWANAGLQSCGQKCCFWTPFDKGIFSKY
jgi:uncharacterized protein (TIGR02117 family)